MRGMIRGLVGVVLVAGAGIASAEDAAGVQVTGNVTLATEYRFRGISQTDRDPAIQGGFDLTTPEGFYAGVWGSNIQFGGSIELDYYGGYRGAINETISYDIGYIYYDYPSASDDGAELDYQEFKAAVSFSGVTLGLNYSNDYTLETGSFWWLFGDYSVELGDIATLGLHVALNQWEDEDDYAQFGLGQPGDSDDNYIDYMVKLSREEWGVLWALAIVGTDLDEDECFGDTKLCDPAAVLSVTKSL